MDIDKLIETLRQHVVLCVRAYGRYCSIFDEVITALSTLQAENEKLRSEAEGMRSNWYKSVEKIQKLRAELERVKAGRDAAIEYLREIEWCAGCKHFGGLDRCKKWAMGQCTEKHDLYEFIGPQKED